MYFETVFMHQNMTVKVERVLYANIIASCIFVLVGEKHDIKRK